MVQGNKSSGDATQALGSGAESGKITGLAPGTRIGHYVVQRLLGAGGMGQVYLAEQRQPVQRRVALKLLPAKLATPVTRAYFEVERQALAQMQHPAIAQVFDAGTSDDGQGYIVMEFVEGQSITAYCDQHDLGTTDTLRLFQRLCQGVQHAHQKGVIHRDLKPDNVLVREVDGKAQPTIIDFGIATGSEARSGQRDRAGTVTYMSPEQMRGQLRDIDTRSDVYALGVMLFELLCGHDAGALTTRLFRSGADVHNTLMAMDDQTARGDVVRDVLLRAASVLPEELRAVLRNALAPDRTDRYGSATALAEDVQRYLDRRPLLAMPHTRAYKARKFVSRHRLGLAATALVVAALVTGMVLAVHGMQRAQVAATKAQLTYEFLGDVLSGTTPDVAKGMDTTLMRKVLDDAAAKAGEELAGRPEVRSTVAHIIATAYSALGLYAQAAEHDGEALEAARKAGLAAVKQAQLQIALALDKANAGVPPKGYRSDVEAAAQLIQGVPEDNEARLSVEHDLAVLEFRMGHLEEALQRTSRVLRLQRQVLPPDSPHVALSESLLATIYSQMGEYRKAEPLFRALLKRSLEENGELNSSTVGRANELAVSLSRQQRFAEAEKVLRHYLPVATQLYGADHQLRMNLYSNLGAAIRQQGRNEAARPYYEGFLQWSLEQFGPQDWHTVVGQSNLAFLLRDAGDLAAAEKHARLSVKFMDAALGANNGARGQLIDLLGTIQLREKDYAGAKASLDRAWKIFTTASGYGADHPLAQKTVKHQIALYQALGKPDKVELWRSRLVDDGGTDG